MNIDLTTGLPELPEGQSWRVGQRMQGMPDYRYYGFQFVNAYYLVIQSERVRQYKKWFRTKTETVYVTEEARMLRIEVDGPAPGAVRGDDDRWYVYDEITPELILEVATKMVEEREERARKEEARRRKQAISESLIGDYPPKYLFVRNADG